MTLRDPRINALALRALDAARNAGAKYADVRLTYNTSLELSLLDPAHINIVIGVSVRALVDGYWGWAASPYLSESDALRLGREATHLAQSNATRGKPRLVDWGTFPAVHNGTWTTPHATDPFTVSQEEMRDWMGGLANYRGIEGTARGKAYLLGGSDGLSFLKQETVFASTEGTYVTQMRYITGATLGGGIINIRPVQAGWEYLRDLHVPKMITDKLDDLDRLSQYPLKSHLEVGRYDIIFTASTMAQLLNATLAPATQLDRALGYEANTDGTSYLGPDPLAILGTTVASPLVTITADRSVPTGVATIKWDDDGLTPEDFPIVKSGVLVDYQTTREQAAWLAPWYQRQGHPAHSHGCAASVNALDYSMQHTPNLTLHPGSSSAHVDDFVASLDHGLIVDGTAVDMDFQKMNGLSMIGGIFGTIYEVRHGRRVAQYNSNQVQMGVLFNTPEIWKNILAIGGAETVETNFLGISRRQEPDRQVPYSISAVPTMIKGLAVIDPTRKA